jgi:DNA-binding XRE family transcriptional regulator
MTPLKQLMNRRMLKNKWLSHVTGIDIVTLSLIMNDKRKPSVVNAIKIARALDTTVEELFGYLVDNQSTTEQEDK